jgi:hypothetical protein
MVSVGKFFLYGLGCHVSFWMTFSVNILMYMMSDDCGAHSLEVALQRYSTGTQEIRFFSFISCAQDGNKPV